MSDADSATALLAVLIDTLRELPQGLDDALRIDRIRALEDVRSAVAAAQARETAAFVASRKAAQQAAGMPKKRIGRAIAGQVGLARRISPNLAQRYVGWAGILTDELPNTFAQLQAGRVSEWRAIIVARETAWLSREHRLAVDAELAPNLEQLGDRRVEAAAKRIGYRLDPRGFVDRFAAAPNDRRVSLRPAPDAMVRLTALLPVAQGVACYAALGRTADSSTAVGDERGRGQIMADQALLDGASEPAHVDGYGPIPAHTARELVTKPSDSTAMWLRRLYTAPTSRQLIAMESRRRFVTAGQRHFVQIRDQFCRTAWCEAPIRHMDHITPHEQRGPTSVVNAQGDCEACNYTKQAAGWTTRRVDNDDGSHEVETITPTGHRYRSRAPDLPRTG